MKFNQSVHGTVVTILATNTLPAPTPIIQFSESSDPFDVSSTAIGDAVKGVNGDLIVWSKATEIEVSVAVISGSPADNVLSLIAEANVPRAGGSNANDTIVIAVLFPNEATSTYTNGVMTDAMIGYSAGSDGRIKDKVYKFKFEDVIITPPLN